MARQGEVLPKRRVLALSVRVSLLLMLATTLPLIITVAISEPLTRPALITQASKVMEADAQNRVQLIDAYLTERLSDVETFSQVGTIQAFLVQRTPADYASVTYALRAVHTRDTHYAVWSLFDKQGHLLLSAPGQPHPHGKYVVPPSDQQELASGTPFFSAVFFDPAVGRAFVDIYVPAISLATHAYLGFVRATLDIGRIWDIVNGDSGVNGTGSYAFILDQSEIRIADPHPSRRFTAIAPLDAKTIQSIRREARYGGTTVPVLADSTFASIQHAAHPPTTFETTPTGEHQVFQMARQSVRTVTWTFFVASPLSALTAIADQQLLITVLVAILVLMLAAFLGFRVSGRITQPIMASVKHLLSNSEALAGVASKQQHTSSEQAWVVDSSQVGLQSVQYYTRSMTVAADRLIVISEHLVRHQQALDMQTAHRMLEEIAFVGYYLADALRLQGKSNEKLTTAIMVTASVNEQIAIGATAATNAAKQMEHVVNSLHQVVGK